MFKNRFAENGNGHGPSSSNNKEPMSLEQEPRESLPTSVVEIQFDNKTTDWIEELRPVLGDSKHTSTPQIHPGSMEETAIFYLSSEGEQASDAFVGTIVSINRALIDEASLFNVVLNPYPDQTGRIFMGEVVGFRINLNERSVDFYVLSEDEQSAVLGASVSHTGKIISSRREEIDVA